MAYIFQEDKLPRLVSVVPGRQYTFFVNKELTNIDDMLAGIMHYVKGVPPHTISQKLRAFLFYYGRIWHRGIGSRSPRCGAG
jgi:hypothetical protein